MDEKLWRTELPALLENKTVLPKYQVLADAVTAAIYAGKLGRDERLPTVRDLAAHLGVSGTTVATAYRILAQQQLITGKVGSGTRVANVVSRRVAPRAVPESVEARYPDKPFLWRRRTQTNHIATLSRAFPQARNYASGTPNPALLPLEVLRRGWVSAAHAVRAPDLQYAGPAPVPALGEQLLRRLEHDLIPAMAADLVVGSSAQQLMTLMIQIASSLFQKAHLFVGVEEPGYPTLFDSYERLGHRLLGIDIDAEGAVPASVAAALEGGAKVLVFTPRAHNPTGVSWSPARLAALTEVLTAYPDVLVIEDDQFAEAANTPVGSLLGDARLEDRVVYIRSFSKVIAPDLRLALAVVRPQLRALLMEGKFYTDGWSSSFSQSALAHAFADERMDEAVACARETYNHRREAFRGALKVLATPDELNVWPAVDGVNVWLELPSGVSAADVAERAAAAGVLVATGEPFFVRVGRDDALRLNTGMMEDGDVARVARVLYDTFREAARSTPALFSHHSL